MNTLQPMSSNDIFINCGSGIMRKSHVLNSKTFILSFQALFWVCPGSCQFLWNMLSTMHLSTAQKIGGNPHHLLWSLLFLKVYGSETVQFAIVGCHEETFHKCCCHFINLVSSLNELSKVTKNFSAMCKLKEINIFAALYFD